MHAIRLLSDEVQRDMALIGVTTLAELAPRHLVRLKDG